MEQKFTTIYKKHGKWYLDWIEEILGINTQGRALREINENLKGDLFSFISFSVPKLSTEALDLSQTIWYVINIILPHWNRSLLAAVF